MKANFAVLVLTGCLTNTFNTGAQNFSADELNRRAIERRAIEAVILGMPAVNYERMLQAAIDDGANSRRHTEISRTQPK